MDDDKLLKVIEYGIEALLIGWLTYLFAYQNYLLYHWHRGLKLPSKAPFLLLGILVAGLFFGYEFDRLMKSSKGKPPVNITPKESSSQGEVQGAEVSEPLTSNDTGE